MHGSHKKTWAKRERLPNPVRLSIPTQKWKGHHRDVRQSVDNPTLEQKQITIEAKPGPREALSHPSRKNKIDGAKYWDLKRWEYLVVTYCLSWSWRETT